MFKKKNKKQKEFGFLSRKDKNYIKELLENGIIKAMSEQDKINITHDEVEKLRFIERQFTKSKNSLSIDYIIFLYPDILKVTLKQLEIFYEYFRSNDTIAYYEDVECMIKNEYNIAKIVEKIMIPYLYAKYELDEEEYKEEIKAIKNSDFDRNKALRYNGQTLRLLIHKRYSIDQILFIFNNNMIYSSYHDIFDYHFSELCRLKPESRAIEEGALCHFLGFRNINCGDKIYVKNNGITFSVETNRKITCFKRSFGGKRFMFKRFFIGRKFGTGKSSVV